MKLHHRGFPRHNNPDLFDWLAERELRDVDPAARWVASRYGLPIYTAATLARQAGLGERAQ